jgi:deoxyribose-phosphate aldolase
MSRPDLARRALALLDLTDLSDTADDAATRALCAKAGGGPVPVAAICIWPRFVRTARAALGTGGGVRIATVVNFPAGGDEVPPVLTDTERAIADGADEIDLVLPWRRVLAGSPDIASAMIGETKARCRGKLLKVILETGEYPDAGAIRRAADLAIAAGADFIKTSTGKTARSATPEAARIMLEAIRDGRRPVGLKPSGGIRTLADAKTYLALADEIMGPSWARPETFRFGASGLYDVLAREIAGESGRPGTESY